MELTILILVCFHSPSLFQRSVNDFVAETCQGLIEEFGIDVSNIPKWNPWVGSNCDEGLYAGLAAGDSRPVCIGVGGNKPTFISTTTVATGTATIRTTTTSATSHGPTQTGIAADCTTYKTIDDGDTCSAVLTTYSLSMAQFYAWNPAGKFPSFESFEKSAN